MQVVSPESLHVESKGAPAMPKPSFPKVSAKTLAEGRKIEMRRIRVPQHRVTQLKKNWKNIMNAIVHHMRLQIRVNPVKSKGKKEFWVELRASRNTTDPGALQKSEEFLSAFMMGFELADAIALLRVDDLYVDSFQVEDVKTVKGAHLSRAIGRIAGQDGKTKHAIENATRTRIIVAGHKIHLLGSFANIKLARDAICALILGAPPGKVYNQMRQVAGRLHERF